MARYVGLATGLLAGFIATVATFAPSGGDADETDPLKDAAVAAAPDVTTLTPAEDPAPDRWTQTGEHGDWAHEATPVAIEAMSVWFNLMTLPASVEERVVAVSDPAKVAARTEKLATYFRIGGYADVATRLNKALVSVASDETYLPYSEFAFADLAVTYSIADDYCQSPCLSRNAFVVFAARPQYKNWDGTWSTGDLRQFQVTLRSEEGLERVATGGDRVWKVTKFYEIPLEGEGASMFEPEGVLPL